LEHYQKVRATFEGPSKDSAHAKPTAAGAPSSIPPRSSSNGTLTASPSGTTLPYRSLIPPKSHPLGGGGKGKGKEPTHWVSELEETDSEAYLTGNDYGTPAHGLGNGSVKGKGRVAVNSEFGGEGEDEDLYG
jgi:hypothetical protein